MPKKKMKRRKMKQPVRWKLYQKCKDEVGNFYSPCECACYKKPPRFFYQGVTMQQFALYYSETASFASDEACLNYVKLEPTCKGNVADLAIQYPDSPGFQPYDYNGDGIIEDGRNATPLTSYIQWRKQTGGIVTNFGRTCRCRQSGLTPLNPGEPVSDLSEWYEYTTNTQLHGRFATLEDCMNHAWDNCDSATS